MFPFNLEMCLNLSQHQQKMPRTHTPHYPVNAAFAPFHPSQSSGAQPTLCLCFLTSHSCHHQRQHHFWPQVHPHFPKQYWHRSPKTSNLSEPVDMSQSSFGTSLPRMTLLASIPCFSGLFPPVHGPGLFSLTYLGGLLSACPSAHSFSTIPGYPQQSHQPCSFHTACTWTTNESTSFTLISPSSCRPEYLTAR